MTDDKSPRGTACHTSLCPPSSAFCPLGSPKVSPLRLLVGIRFQVSFTPLVGVLFTFPSRYSFAIGRTRVLRLGGWSPQIQTGFHVSRPTQGHTHTLPVRGSHPLRPDFPDGSGSHACATGLVRFRSPLLAESRLISFPPATEMFQFARFAFRPYGFRTEYRLSGGFPHSDIPGSKIAPISPGLFAGCHVLHRLRAPRHPPNALTSLERESSLPRTKPQAEKTQLPREKLAQSASIQIPTGTRRRPKPIHPSKTQIQHPAKTERRNKPIKKQTRTWWRRSDSNRRPPACKAGALPTELRPPKPPKPEWWARVDLNHRPHAYQACALAT
jgi:hypothetical protein